MRHCFAISAYRESPYLEECIKSLMNQDGRDADDSIIICTSTPNAHISSLAEKYGLRLYVRDGASSLKDDWNFAVEMAVNRMQAGLVTIAHQDDIYLPEYLPELKEAAGRYTDMSLFCTRYATIDGDGRPLKTRAESVKRILRLPLRLRCISGMSIIKKLPLIFGNGIGCPSCTYNVELTGIPIFRNDYHFVIDWETLLRLAGMRGRFICAERELMEYRVHPGAETRKNIEDHNREREEAEVFGRIWPRTIAGLLMHFYRGAYTDYDADTDGNTNE